MYSVIVYIPGLGTGNYGGSYGGFDGADVGFSAVSSADVSGAGTSMRCLG